MFKKRCGFTLAEILVSLMIIGIIAMLTVPSVIRGINDAQFKTGYKKAYNTILNTALLEKLTIGMPSTSSSDDVGLFFAALGNTLSVKYFVPANTSIPNSGTRINQNSGYSAVTIVGSSGKKYTAGSGESAPETTITTALGSAPWLIADDGIAYTVIAGGSGDSQCRTKKWINSASNSTEAYNISCALVIADVNGLAKGPNRFEAQTQKDGSNLGVNSIGSNQNLTQLIGDQYYIYIGLDGASSGTAATTVSGRLTSEFD